MNDPFRVLEDEHRVLESVLDALESFTADDPESRPAEARSTLARFAEFFRDFGDGIHHRKEEDLLFERLLRDGDMSECGPVNRYLAEHGNGREAVRKIAAAGAGEGPLTDEHRTDLADTARAFAQMLRDHIRREDLDLFPAARRVLPSESLQVLAGEFEQFDRDPDTASRIDRCVALAKWLTSKYVPDLPPPSRPRRRKEAIGRGER